MLTIILMILLVLLLGGCGGLIGDLAETFAEYCHGEEDKTIGPWEISLRDFIPFPMFIRNLGKSPYRYQEKLPLRILCTELVCGFASIAIFFVYGFTIGYAMLMFMTFVFAVCLISDLRWREIPNEINIIMAVLAICLAVAGVINWEDLVTGMVPGLVCITAGIILFFIRPADGFGIGGGDLKFLLTTGMLMGSSFAFALICFGGFATLLFYGATFVADIKNNTQTPVPMMVGFTTVFVFLMLTHYLSLPEFDMFLPECETLIPLISSIF